MKPSVVVTPLISNGDEVDAIPSSLETRVLKDAPQISHLWQRRGTLSLVHSVVLGNRLVVVGQRAGTRTLTLLSKIWIWELYEYLKLIK